MNVAARGSMEFAKISTQQVITYLEATRNILETYELGDEYMEALSGAIDEAKQLLQNPYISNEQKETIIQPYIRDLQEEKNIQDFRWEEIMLKMARTFSIDWQHFIKLYRKYRENPNNFSVESIRIDDKSNNNLMDLRMSFLQQVINQITHGKELGELGFSRRTPNAISRVRLH